MLPGLVNGLSWCKNSHEVQLEIRDNYSGKCKPLKIY